MSEKLHIDPAGAFIQYEGRKYYRDGVLFGTLLPEAEVYEERPMPTLWSSIVIDYRKKPVQVQAIELTRENATEVSEWCGGQVVRDFDPLDDSRRFVCLNIPTLEGVMRANEGDYIIKGVKGEFYPCKPDIFVATYELA